jgi:amidase
VILGKANMSEFASGRAYSSIGGEMRNPHDLTRTPLGSSGGSAIAVAAAFAVFAIGTDTGGSIRNPAFTTGIVGLKPTHGLISRDGIVPLALTLDTPGPFARTVHDVAVALGVLAGIDPSDEATKKSAGRVDPDYTSHLRPDALRGARLGLMRDFIGRDPEVDWVAESSVAAMRKAGATVVDVRLPAWLMDAKSAFYDAIRYPEFAAQIGPDLQTLGPAYPKTLADLLARAEQINAFRDDRGGPDPNRWNLLRREAASVGLDDYRYTSVRDQALPLVRAIVEGLIASENLDALVYPTLPTPAPLITAPPNPPGGAAASPVNLANLTGFPDLVVPAGFTSGRLPVTISFLGPAFSEGRLLALGFSFEHTARARRLPVHTPPLSGESVVIRK